MGTTTKGVYRVTGMSCGHCRESILEAVQRTDGVTHVELDLASGRLDVDGTGVSTEQIRSAVELAGYRLEEPAS